jgi:hypothetical protein
MNFKKTALVAAATLAFAAVSTTANAYTTSVTFPSAISNPTGMTSFASATTVDFNSAPLGGPLTNYQVSGGGTTATYNKGAIFAGSASGITADPAFSSGDFWSVGISPTTQLGPGSVIFSTAVKYFGFLWGSIDKYNTVSFDLGGTGTNVSFTGNDVIAGASGIQGKPAYFNFFATGNETIKGVSFASTQNAFETDNHAFSVSAVPEPETYTLMLAGLGLMGVVARRRKAKQA